MELEKSGQWCRARSALVSSLLGVAGVACCLGACGEGEHELEFLGSSSYSGGGDVVSLCINYYGKFSPGLTERDVESIVDSGDPCPSENSLGACVYPPDAKGAFGARSEQIYYANSSGTALAAPTAGYEHFEDGDVCDVVGLWRMPYDGTSPKNVPARLYDD